MRQIVGGLCLVGLALLTHERVAVWASDEALWSDATRVSPQKARGWVNLGTAYGQQGRYFEAEAAFRVAERLSTNPTRPAREREITRRLVNLNLAALAFVDQRYGEAWRRASVIAEAPWTNDRATVALHREVASALQARLSVVCGGPCASP